MKKIMFLLAIALIVIATVLGAGCINKNEQQEEVPIEKEYDTSVYDLKDEVKDTDDKTIVTRTYSFEYKGNTYTVEVNVPQYRLNNYKANTYKLYNYQRGFVKDVYLKDVVEQITNQANTDDRQELAKLLIYFVKSSISYGYDINVHGQEDYWAYPVETLINGKGDCDCYGNLMTALLRTAGYDAITIYHKAGNISHVATLVSDIEPYMPKDFIPSDDWDKTYYTIEYKDKSYYYLDSSGTLGVGYATSRDDIKQWYSIYDETYVSVYENGVFNEEFGFSMYNWVG